MEHHPSNTNKIEFLVTIIDYNMSKAVADLYLKKTLPIQMIMHGHGSADSELLDTLGLTDTKKAVILSILTETMSHHMFELLKKDLFFSKPGTGIAFTLPLSSISSYLSKLCNQADQSTKFESEETRMTQNEPFDLILTIVTSGYFNEVMEVAKAAGATGGTLLHARGLGSEEASRFLGITISQEKDIVLILAPREIRAKIMEHITHELGLSTEGKGVCFSLPVNATLGLGSGEIN
ncbi:MAG: hypothetical protein K0S47_1595 [Herbinix sp.]|jgi:nitrogen regulatory protein PII|nr:hypothetical protein [Herbinix sp.]